MFDVASFVGIKDCRQLREEKKTVIEQTGRLRGRPRAVQECEATGHERKELAQVILFSQPLKGEEFTNR